MIPPVVVITVILTGKVPFGKPRRSMGAENCPARLLAVLTLRWLTNTIAEHVTDVRVPADVDGEVPFGQALAGRGQALDHAVGTEGGRQFAAAGRCGRDRFADLDGSCVRWRLEREVGRAARCDRRREVHRPAGRVGRIFENHEVGPSYPFCLSPLGQGRAEPAPPSV